MPRLAVVLCAVVIASAVSPVTLAAQDGGALFEENCSGCHTIGEGDSGGPDLKDLLTRRDREWVMRFIRDPEAVLKSGDPYAVALVNRFDGAVMPDAGDLGHESIEAIVRYIERRSGCGADVDHRAPEAAVTPAEVARGHALFTGDAPLVNAGPACISCHDVGAATPFGGGALGPGLARVSERLNGPRAIAVWLTAPPTPVMRTIYRRSPLSADEARALAAFFSDRAGAGATDRRPWQSMLPFVALGLATTLVGYMAMGVAWRERFRGVRRPLVTGATRQSGDVR